MHRCAFSHFENIYMTSFTKYKLTFTGRFKLMEQVLSINLHMRFEILRLNWRCGCGNTVVNDNPEGDDTLRKLRQLGNVGWD